MTYDYRADSILGGALAYWLGKQGGRAMPARRDIDPTEIPRLLPNLQLIEVINGGSRFRYRLIGTALVEAFGRDYTGTYLDELFPDERGAFAHGLFQAVCTARQPMFLRSTYSTLRAVDLVANRLYLPLSDGGTNVGIILGALTFEFGSGAIAGVWETATLDTSACNIEPVDLNFGEPRA